MQIILANANFNDSGLRRYISKLTVDELNKLTEPCYKADWKKHYYELLHLTNLEEKDIKSFIKRFYYGTKAQDALLQSDVGSNFLFILMYHFLQQKDQVTFSTLMLYYMIRQYSNLFRISFSNYCADEVFTYTLNHLNTTHLFSREKTIPNALFYLSKQMKARYTKYFLELDPEKISLFIYESRSRIFQSLKSFAEEYYRNKEKGLGISSQKETETGEEIYPSEIDKGSRLAELVANKITIYKEIDYKAVEQARSLTKINTSYTMLITKGLQKTDLNADVKFIIELYLRNIKSVKEICGKDSLAYIKRLMSLKRTIKEVYFKQEINNLLQKTIKSTLLASKYQKLTLQTQFQINSFLAFYLAIYTKNLVC